MSESKSEATGGPTMIRVAGREYEFRMKALHFYRLSERFGPVIDRAQGTAWSSYDFKIVYAAVALVINDERKSKVLAEWVAEHCETPFVELAETFQSEVNRFLSIKKEPDAEDGDEPGAEGMPDPEAKGAS